MKVKWPIILLVAVALVVCGVLLFFPKSVLPIDSEKVSHIEFRIYPQDTPNFTVTDDARVLEIVSAINNLSVEPTDTRPARMLMYGKEASNRKQEIDRQHYTIPNQRPKDKHCGKI